MVILCWWWGGSLDIKIRSRIANGRQEGADLSVKYVITVFNLRVLINYILWNNLVSYCDPILLCFYEYRKKISPKIN